MAEASSGEDLLHDARNLIGTLGLYCDLLSMPGVLKQEHREYVDDLRLVGSRSGALIGRLINQLVQVGADTVPLMTRATDAVRTESSPRLFRPSRRVYVVSSSAARVC